MTPRTITATELAKNLSEILNRVRYRGEEFVIERNGQRIATLSPAGPAKPFTVGDLIQLVRSLPEVDEDFERDLREVRSSQPPMPILEWPD